ncbi:MAG: CDP-alcohol phosphatidyltransferase family protein [Anaerolineales bacterium]|uniref:CDP-alcohol phosphatidyltransferase family protein n=1 Tax=Candidatus Villigracilis vicinus TaxID=3140679 RepID=UPI0031364EA2|nr:CDP-alcohol phosphatidyltransferase family protein [Anaerolineales bacterium]MBK7449909.1 CDP-alcohol phosphatidyltransferase family protein [Anaerolineales bacterium]MBK9781385.1 CDP-alcohol phosphatidyltransferase family protein [Anaerolineales bacterium]
MTSSAQTKPNLIRSILAWGVHLFTATGAIWGLLGIFAIFENDYKMMIVWMIVAMLVDGFDGMLARWADVKKYANGIDGALLDNILDYLNYVVVPAIFMIHTDLLPEPVKWLTACLILLTSAYQFTQTDAKTDDHHFKGFPSYWNVAALYMLLMNLPPWVNFGFLMLFNIMVFIPVKYIYPSRNSYLRTLTLGLTYLYGAVGIWGLLQYPNHPQWVVWASFLYVGYYLILSLIPKKSAHAN